jgi:hypothetical protein
LAASTALISIGCRCYVKALDGLDDAETALQKFYFVVDQKDFNRIFRFHSTLRLCEVVKKLTAKSGTRSRRIARIR